MKTITLLLISISFCSYAQNQLHGNIQKKFSIGSKELVEEHQTNLRLYNMKTKTWSDYYSTDSKGAFSIQGVKPGKYLLQVNDPIVKEKNIVFVEVPASDRNQVHPIVVDRIQNKVFINKPK